MTKETLIKDIDFKKLTKECKSQEDISKLTKEFMKNSRSLIYKTIS